MYSSDLYKRLRAEIDKIKLIDTHEHLPFPDELADMGRLDFGRLFTHYACSDLVSAGMPTEDMEEVRNVTPNSGWSPGEKWRAMKPYYQKTWNTGYCECLRISIQELFGIEDLRDDTVDLLSEKMDGVPRETWTRTVFDKAGIDIAMNQPQSLTGSPYVRHPDLFLYDMIDQFSCPCPNTAASEYFEVECRNLADYLGIIDLYFERFADESPALKIRSGILRTLRFDKVPFTDASRIFASALDGDSPPDAKDAKALEDFIIHYFMRKAGEYDLPVKFHTGLIANNFSDARNSRAAYLTNLFTEYPKTKFDIYHISWPYTEELISICKSFPNVYIDFCWAWIFNPPAARRYLSDMIETIPLNKIHGFGGDFLFVEGVYGHSVMARREIARVLAEKVEEGRFTEDYAVRAASRILRENALENFRIEDKRELCERRASHAMRLNDDNGLERGTVPAVGSRGKLSGLYSRSR